MAVNDILADETINIPAGSGTSNWVDFTMSRPTPNLVVAHVYNGLDVPVRVQFENWDNFGNSGQPFILAEVTVDSDRKRAVSLIGFAQGAADPHIWAIANGTTGGGSVRIRVRAAA
ncbi:MAG TPA: hypothetical protein VF188_04755 [Longimicrobiales bacterium]